MNRFFGAILTCSLFCLVTVGCDSGPPVGTVTGTVTMDGEPVDNALISFVPQEGGTTATGKTDANGNYELHRLSGPGAVVGTYKVVVTTVKEPAEAAPEVATGSEDYAAQATGGTAGDYNEARVAEPIPARYNKQSELIKEVNKGENEIDLELTSK